MNKNVVTLIPALSTETDIDKFFKDAAAEAKSAGRKKVIVITVDMEGDEYAHSLSTIGLKSSECISLLEITKNTLVKSMS